MRAWGIFLGALTSAVLVVTGVVLGRDAAQALSLLAAPALLLHLLPVLVARWQPGTSTPKVRVTDDLAAEPYTTAHYRVVTEESDDVVDEAVPAKAGRAAVRP